MGQKLQMTTSLIDQNHRIPLKQKDAEEQKKSFVGDDVEEVDYVDRLNWRKGLVSSNSGSADSNHEDEVTESEPPQSYDQTNPLKKLT